MLLPQWVLVPTSSIWLLSLPVPTSLLSARCIGVWPVESPTAMPKREQLTVFPKSNRSETLKCILHPFVCTSYGFLPKSFPISLASVCSVGIASSSVLLRDQTCLTRFPIGHSFPLACLAAGTQALPARGRSWAVQPLLPPLLSPKGGIGSVASGARQWLSPALHAAHKGAAASSPKPTEQLCPTSRTQLGAAGRGFLAKNPLIKSKRPALPHSFLLSPWLWCH